MRINELKQNAKNQQISKFVGKFEAIWEGEAFREMLEKSSKLQPDSVAAIYAFWLGLSKMYNKLPGIKPAERVKIVHFDHTKVKNKII